MNGVPEGTRNNTAASIAGRILNKVEVGSEESVGWPKMINWNSHNMPPLDEKELRSVWESIKRYPRNNTGGSPASGGSSADQVVQLIMNNPEIKLFKNQNEEAYIMYPVKQWVEYYPIGSGVVKNWIGRLYFETYGKVVKNDAIKNAITTLEGIALYQGDEYNLQNRVNRNLDDIYYSLSNKQWEAVEITKDGWKIVSTTPVLFNRYAHQNAQVYPTVNGDAKKIFDFVNVKNEEHKILFLILLVSSFIPGIDHPILYIYGSQGAAKSTTSRLLKEIIDPSSILVSELPKDTRELAQILFHHWYINFDNVSYLSSELSDLLSRTVTGTGFSKRKLYSDDDDVFYSFKRCVCINGINLVAYKADLLDRSILVQLERVPKDKRKYAEQLNKEFKDALPGILGGIFDTLSAASKLYQTVNIKEVPRMADYARWGYAIAEVLGYGGEEFIRIYTKNAELQHDEVINNSVVGTFILKLMGEQKKR